MLLVKGDVREGHLQPGAQAIVSTGTKGSVLPRPGEVIYVWTTELHGGEGLAAFGGVVATEATTRPDARGAGEHEEYDIAVLVDSIVIQPLTKLDLQPHREAGLGTPLGELADRLYRNSHRKVFRLSKSAADYLRDRFNQTE